MKHLLLFFSNLFIFINTMHAQNNTAIGIYNLQGVMETASGFKLNADSTFEFYFSYGALDRYGKGKWQITNDKLILNGRPFRIRGFHRFEQGSVCDT